MDAFLLDLKYGVRSLWRDKGFALTVLLTFSVCIAANAALFAIVNSVVLRPLPLPNANSILIMSNEYPNAGVIGINNSSSGDYFDRLREMTVFESQAVFRPRNQTVDLNGSPQQIRGMLVTPSWFRLLRVSPVLGRAFTEEEGDIGNDQKVILSHGLWRQLYAADKSAIAPHLPTTRRPFPLLVLIPPDFNFIDPD